MVTDRERADGAGQAQRSVGEVPHRASVVAQAFAPAPGESKQDCVARAMAKRSSCQSQESADTAPGQRGVACGSALADDVAECETAARARLHDAMLEGSRAAGPASSVAASPPPADDDAGVGGLPPIKRAFVVPPEKCASLTPEKAETLVLTILGAPRTPGDSYKDDPLPKLREMTNSIRALVAAARQCVRPLDAWKIINPRGTWLGPASETNIEQQYAAAEAWAAALDAEIDRTQTCVMTTGCMAARAAADAKEALEPVCEMIAQRAKDVRDIARERSNPGGVVDLKLLHRIGEEIQWIDNEELPARKARYAAAAHKPFTAGLCK